MCAGLGALPCPGSDATSLSVVPVSGWTALVRWCPAVQLPEEQWVGPGSPSFLCSEKVAVRWGGAPRGALCLGGRVPAAGSGASLLGGGTHAWTVESGASLPSAQWLCLWVWFQAALLPGAFGSQVSLGSLTVPPLCPRGSWYRTLLPATPAAPRGEGVHVPSWRTGHQVGVIIAPAVGWLL